MADFIPKDNDSLVTWATNLKTKIATHGPTLGMTAAQITAFQNLLQAVIDKVGVVAGAKSALSSAASGLRTTKKTNLTSARTTIAQWKTSGLLSDAMAQDMNVVGTGTAFDPAAYKTKLTVEVHAGFVRIKFVRGEADGVNIYVRLQGETTWRFLARDTNSPYDDHTPLATPAPTTPGGPTPPTPTAEVREYRAFGVLNDEEIGLASDIVSATFAG